MKKWITIYSTILHAIATKFEPDAADRRAALKKNFSPILLPSLVITYQVKKKKEKL